MKGITKRTILFLTVTFFASTLFAQPLMMGARGKGLRMRSPQMLYHILKVKKKELNVTDDQLKKIKNLLFSFEEKMVNVKNEISKNRLELKKLLTEEEGIDYGKIEAILRENSNLRNSMIIERLKLKEEIENVLTPEQRDALRKMAKERLKERKPFFKGRRQFMQK